MNRIFARETFLAALHRIAPKRTILYHGAAILFTVFGWPSGSQAVPYYWNTGNGTWATGANWSNNATSGGTTGIVPGASDTATFNQSSVNGNQTITLGAQSILGLTFANTGTTNLTGTSLNIGTGGVTVNNGAGAVTMGVFPTPTLPINLNGSQAWANNDDSPLTIHGAISGTGSPTLTNSGSGSGGVTLQFAVDASVNKIVQDSATSQLNLRANNGFSGGLEIKKGTVAFGNPGALGAGTVTIGNTSGSDSATLLHADNNTLTFSNPISLASTTTGTLTIGIISDSGTHTVTFGGALTGNNHLTFENRSGDESISYSGLINNVGTITHTGAGSGILNLPNVGANVTGIIQDSATSMLQMRGTNASTGGIVVKRGTLHFGNSPSNLGANNVITLGNAAGGSDAATLLTGDNSSPTFANPIILAANTTGQLTIAITNDGGANVHTFAGGVTGNNNLWIENPLGDDSLAFSTASLNNAGTITHIGAGTGSTTINAVIGPNVTGLTQNSATSLLLLNGANTFAGTTLVSAGTLQLGNLNALRNSTLDVSGAGTVTFNVAGTNTYNLGGLQGAGSLNAGANSLNVGGLSPGNSPGLLTVTAGMLSLFDTSLFEIDGYTRGTQYDAVNVTGNLTYGGDLDILFGFVPLVNDTFNLFDFTGTQNGNFTRIDFLNAGFAGTFDNATGVLTVTANGVAAVPEPVSAGTWLAMFGVAAASVVLRMRRRTG